MGVQNGRLLAGIALVALPTVPAAIVAAAGFVGALEDLPLMPGLTEVEDSQTVFETGSGRIVQALAAGSVTGDGVLRFYEGTLPQLGWCRAAPGVFQREGERLTLEIGDGSGASVTVRFTLAPAPAAGCP